MEHGKRFERRVKETISDLLGKFSYVKHNNTNSTKLRRVPDFHINLINSYVEVKSYANADSINVQKKFKQQYEFIQESYSLGFFLLTWPTGGYFRVIAIDKSIISDEECDTLEDAIWRIVDIGKDHNIREAGKMKIVGELH